MKNVPTDLLRAFVTVAETQNFTRAGEVLFRTQAAVSMQIRRLEEQLGSALFERDSRGTALTDQGKFLLSYAKRILQLNELLESLELGRASRLIRFGAPDDYATILLPKVLRIFSETFPAVQVEIVCAASSDLLREMKQQNLDLVLTVSRPSPVLKGFASRQPLFWVGAADDAAHRQDPLPLALFPHGCACRELSLEALRGRRPSLECGSDEQRKLGDHRGGDGRNGSDGDGKLSDRARSDKAQSGRWRSAAWRGRDPAAFRAGCSERGPDARRIRLAGDTAEPRCRQAHEHPGAELRPVEVHNGIRAKADRDR